MLKININKSSHLIVQIVGDTLVIHCPGKVAWQIMEDLEGRIEYKKERISKARYRIAVPVQGMREASE